ncbi:Cleavage and polyadenylation specificity factor subunit 3-I [Histomonas meleagridis]|uniref:Cleavage and polyadenylation specificity factor subunit 3-I n=1 Tax=Histomonas meleagridis TaxID=135588 RepID=UPI00355A2D28|nr:Cleavage and polyadenylation specificity factor subunit 3-I [Histomonas meleagridis]KAH0806101.1 Cleavage and polyadenylation specificity factor subunit 3-I [Histomonas meleagridis]
MQEIPIGDDTLTITPLGAGQEVGRSCIVLKYRGHTIMLDCGVHPGYMETVGLPFFDAINPADVDLLLITHFHIDHCAAVPWFLTQTNFHGKCYMTPLTKSIFKILLQDYVRLSSGSGEQYLFNKMDLDNCLPMIMVANNRQTITYNGIKICCYQAGHVLGACMWMVEIDGVRVLYTGDFSLEDERHLKGAEIPPVTPDVLIIESTHGISRNEGRFEREYRFIEYVTKIVERGGRCLIPIFALGRVQEILLILDEFWDTNPRLHSVQIYYGSNLAKKAMQVYNNFIGAANEGKITGQGNFKFKYIKYVKSVEEINDTFPCVVLAAPAMLQNGMSRTLFDRWASNPLNGVIIPGYTVENTLAKDLFSEPKEVPTMNGNMIPRKISIHNVSFSGHSDFTHTSQFIKALQVKRIILVHGASTEMERLRDRLTKDFAYLGVEVYAPGDCETAQFEFKSNPTALVDGSLIECKDHLTGLIVRKDFNHIIVSPNELSKFSSLKPLTISMKIQQKLTRPLSDYKEFLARHFGSVLQVQPEMLQIGKFLKIEQKDQNSFTLEWDTDPMSDMIADNVAMMLMSYDPTSVKEEPNDLFLQKLQSVLQSRWGNVEYDQDSQYLQLTVKDVDVFITFDPDQENGIIIECNNDEITKTINELAAPLYNLTKPMTFPER